MTVPEGDLEACVREALAYRAATTVTGAETALVAPGHRRRRARPQVWAGLALAAAAITAIGVVTARRSDGQHPVRVATDGRSGVTTPTSSPRAATSVPATTTPPLAVDGWSAFPVTASPRPLVLTQGLVSGPPGGFTTSEDKEAFLSGALTGPPVLPPGPPRAGGYPVVSAADALQALRASGSGHASTVLVVTAVELGSATFETDRGSMALPAWRFSLRNVQNKAAVLAVAPSARFSPLPQSPSPISYPSVGAHLGADGRTLTLMVAGAPAGTGPCTADYAADVEESTATVAVAVRETRATLPPPGVFCHLDAHPRQTTVVLAAPLGARVVIDTKTDAAVTVTP